MTNGLGVNIKLGGAMLQYAPADNPGSRHVFELVKQTSVQDLLDTLHVPVEQPLMIILNDTMVARPDYGQTLLSDGDNLSLMPPIQAG